MTGAAAPEFKIVLSIETSCDDSSVAVVDHLGNVLAQASANQDQAHMRFGGVVPEIASRNHTEHILPLVEKVMAQARLTPEQISGLAVTNSPGLLGSLLVGLVTAKSLALAWEKPFIGVNHLEGHLLAPFLRDDQYAPPNSFQYPYVALAVSGGHTSMYIVHDLGNYEVIGQTLDDAAGEAFDKFGKLIGLGFPGGALVDKNSLGGSVSRFSFPMALYHEANFDFSFSGMKAAAVRLVGGLSPDEVLHNRADLCASFQEAVVDILVHKLSRACAHYGLTRAVLTGGVSANSRLRAKSETWAKAAGIELVVPPLRYCTDNAAMIGLAGIRHLNLGEFSDHSLAPKPRDPLGSSPTMRGPKR